MDDNYLGCGLKSCCAIWRTLFPFLKYFSPSKVTAQYLILTNAGRVASQLMAVLWQDKVGCFHSNFASLTVFAYNEACIRKELS